MQSLHRYNDYMQCYYTTHLPLTAVCVYLIRGLQKEELVLLTHGDSVDKVADGFKVVAQSGNIIAGEQHARLALTLINII